MGDERTEDFRAHRRQTLGLPIRDDRTRMALLDSNQPHLESVSDRIGPAIIEFMSAHNGQQFHADDLMKFVEDRCGKAAPESAGRVLRKLRHDGIVNYVVEDRGRSLYREGVG
jgi:hypothetical protein